MKKLAGGRIDLAFLSMYGRLVSHLGPAVAFPMHMNGVDYWHEGAARAIEQLSPGTRAVAFDNKGERFAYAGAGVGRREARFPRASCDVQ